MPLTTDQVAAFLVRYIPIRTRDEEDTARAVLRMVQVAGGMMTYKQEQEYKNAQRQANS